MQNDFLLTFTEDLVVGKWRSRFVPADKAELWRIKKVADIKILRICLELLLIQCTVFASQWLTCC